MPLAVTLVVVVHRVALTALDHPSTVADQPHVDYRHRQILEAPAEALSVVTPEDVQERFAHSDYRVQAQES